MSRRELPSLGNCGVCAAPYEHRNASVVKKEQGTLTLHVDCGSCKSSALLAIYSGMKGLVTTVGVPSDFTKRDLKELKRSRKITSDDVLDVHMFLEKKKHK